MAPRHLSATPAPPSRRGGPRSLRTAWSTGPTSLLRPRGRGTFRTCGPRRSGLGSNLARPPARRVPRGGPSTPPCKPRGTWWWLVAQALTTLMKRLPRGRPHTKRPVAVKSAGPDPASRARRCCADAGPRALPRPRCPQPPRLRPVSSGTEAGRVQLPGAAPATDVSPGPALPAGGPDPVAGGRAAPPAASVCARPSPRP